MPSADEKTYRSEMILKIELRANPEKFQKSKRERSERKSTKVHYQNTKNATEGKFDKEKGKQNKLSA